MGNTETQTAEAGEKSNTIKLKFPVQFGEDTITEVTVRRIKGKDLKGLKDLQNSHDDQLKLIARIIDQPTAVVDGMDVSTDLQTIMERVMDFLPSGQ